MAILFSENLYPERKNSGQSKDKTCPRNNTKEKNKDNTYGDTQVFINIAGEHHRSSLRFIKFFTIKSGLCFVSSNILAIYSPIMPMEISWIPLINNNNTITVVMPGTLIPTMSRKTIKAIPPTSDKDARTNTTIEASFIGNEENEISPSTASLINPRYEYFGLSANLSVLSYSIPAWLKPNQLLKPLMNRFFSGILFRISQTLLEITQKSPESRGI